MELRLEKEITALLTTAFSKISEADAPLWNLKHILKEKKLIKTEQGKKYAAKVAELRGSLEKALRKVNNLYPSIYK